ncbi:hypothetical protein PTE30175_02400 [Pandoraea terrae]|uniref:Uncharacterized protein n=1 Tax=Pandoraea terrae TaxID=1537710 RepID=A0A5E4V9Z0_9BURK|nr:hypothetical protein [Pandoraea terrae]VVE07710.1 hypothetical protein PTE30175_02400 [Pandoraea terrae]
MNRLAIVLDGLMLLYLAAAAVVGMQASQVIPGVLLANVLGILLGLLMLAVLAAPFYVSLVVLATMSERHLRLAAWLHRLLLALMIGLTMISMLAGHGVEISAPLFALVATVSIVNLIALSRQHTQSQTFHRFGH